MEHHSVWGTANTRRGTAMHSVQGPYPNRVQDANFTMSDHSSYYRVGDLGDLGNTPSYPDNFPVHRKATHTKLSFGQKWNTRLKGRNIIGPCSCVMAEGRSNVERNMGG
jgi:hypothetical protein